jgi:hypothetical protein
MPNRVGALSRVTEALKKARVNILHVAAWSEGGKAHFHLVTSKNAAARRALSRLGVRSREGDVVVVNLRNKVGVLDRVAHRLAKGGVNISCLSATTGGKSVAVILNTRQNRKALRVL